MQDKLITQRQLKDQISNLQRIQQLDSDGHLRPLIKAGYFPAKVLMHCDVFLYVDAQFKAGVKKERAVRSAEVMFNMCRANVYKILKSFK